MDQLELVKFPNPILRRKARKVGKVTDAERSMLADMAGAMYLSQGVGLAAVQVGIDRQLAVVDTGSGLIKMINPAIIKKEGIEVKEEGCLSCPGECVKVKRAKNVTVSYLTEKGEVAQLRAEGLLARAIQHEIDHLDGTLIIDYLGPIKKLLLKSKKRKMA